MSDPGLTISGGWILGALATLAATVAAIAKAYHSLTIKVLEQQKADSEADHAIAGALQDLTDAIQTRNSENGRE